MKVILDSNCLMMLTEFKINIYDEIKKLIPDAEFITSAEVVAELEKINNLHAKVALSSISSEEVRIEKMGRPVDDALIKYAKENNAVLCSNDKELRRKALKRGVPVIFMRAKKKLDIIRP
ncbi:hypothetical protein DRN74_00790 [Candidatus Micrarchaeota archaeon]|nr:MAG: hypothetical protein DRN74_00790 [Candidatus Micrarchaeota archaeon]